MSADDEDHKILIGRRHRKSKIAASRNLLMPDEFTDTKTKDQFREQRDEACGKDFVHVKVPWGYLRSESFQMRSGMAQNVALRKAELLRDDLLVEKQEEDYIVGDYKNQLYQILVTYDDGIDFVYSTDLPSWNYQDYSDSLDATPKSAEKEAEPTRIKDKLSSDHWVMKEDGLLIRKHIVPRTNLYDPDLITIPLRTCGSKRCA